MGISNHQKLKFPIDELRGGEDKSSTKYSLKLGAKIPAWAGANQFGPGQAGALPG
jgi:hypothetical protein